MNTLFAMAVRVQIPYCRRKTDSSSSDVNSVVLDDQLLRSKLDLLLVLDVGLKGLEEVKP